MKLECAKCGEKVDRGIVLHTKCYEYYIKKIKRLEKKIEKIQNG
jgi:hypothetical protein